MEMEIWKSLHGFTTKNGGLNLSEMKHELNKIFPDDTFNLNRNELSKKYISLLNKEQEWAKYIKRSGSIDDIDLSKCGVVVLIGLQGSTKSSYAKYLSSKVDNSIIISRDDVGGTEKSLLPLVRLSIYSGKFVILDGTHLTEESRNIYKEFSPHFIYLESNIINCQIRILSRMFEKYGEIFMEGKLPAGQKDPHVFPPVALFRAGKILTVPDNAVRIKIPRPVINPKSKGKALFLDIDGTLRKTDHLVNKYPIDVNEVIPMFDLDLMIKKLQNYIDDGYLLFGISNQAGIYKGIVSKEKVEACFLRTTEMLSLSFPILYCPHKNIPISCYCRKPQVANPLLVCLKYNINPELSLFVGDMKTDQTTAERLSIPFIYANKFFI